MFIGLCFGGVLCCGGCHCSCLVVSEPVHVGDFRQGEVPGVVAGFLSVEELLADVGRVVRAGVLWSEYVLFPHYFVVLVEMMLSCGLVGGLLRLCDVVSV